MTTATRASGEDLGVVVNWNAVFGLPKMRPRIRWAAFCGGGATQEAIPASNLLL